MAGSPWTGLALGLALGVALASAAPSSALDWQPGMAVVEPWRWWTSALVHWGPAHLFSNLLGLAALALIGWLASLPRWATVCWAFAWPLGHLGLLAEPHLAHYGGLSGMLHAGTAVASVALGVAPARAVRSLGLLLGLALAIKLSAERAGMPAAATLLAAGPASDLVAVPGVHVGGALAGWALAAACAIAASAKRAGAR